MSGDIIAHGARLSRTRYTAGADRPHGNKNPQSDATTYSEDGVDLTMIRWMLSLTPAERLNVLQAAANSILERREWATKRLETQAFTRV
jgi:hypothetical protein